MQGGRCVRCRHAVSGQPRTPRRGSAAAALALDVRGTLPAAEAPQALLRLYYGSIEALLRLYSAAAARVPDARGTLPAAKAPQALLRPC